MPLSCKLLAIAIILLMSYSAFGQTGALPGDNDKTKGTDGTSSVKFGINYQSNTVFMGRTDTVSTPSLIPQVKYTLASGIYFSGSIDLLPNRRKKKLDGGDLSVGYDLDITDDLNFGASYSKLFYNSNSTQIASSISSTFNVNFDYDIGDIVTPSISADYNLNKKSIGSDIFVGLSLSHEFEVEGLFGDDDKLLITPTITANTGSQNFYEAYLITKKIKGVKRSAAEEALIARYTGQLGQFRLLDYELSAPVEYKTGHFIFQFTPTYAIVKNQLPSAIMSRISNKPSVFYFETGVSLKF